MLGGVECWEVEDVGGWRMLGGGGCWEAEDAGRWRILENCGTGRWKMVPFVGWQVVLILLRLGRLGVRGCTFAASFSVKMFTKGQCQTDQKPQFRQILEYLCCG